MKKEYNILEEAKELFDELSEYRRYLHTVAEIGFDLPKTTEYVGNILTEIGISTEFLGSGIVATLGEGQGSTVLLRADMDALPIKEQTGLSYSSQNGNMHACGHDMHTAMLLGAARLLKEHEKDLYGRIKLVFQPAEERLMGAKEMIKAGVLDDHKPDAALMLHVVTARDIPTGTVIVPTGGVIAPSADYFSLRIKGRGSHGASPKEGIDPITCGARILLGLEELSARELLGSGSILTVGKFFGGTAANAIADEAVMEGTIRSYDDELRETLKVRISEITEGISYAFGARTEAEFTEGCPAFVADGALSSAVKIYLTELLGKNKILVPDGFVGGGSEDFSYFAEKVPSLMIALSAGANEYTLHHPKVRFDESVLPIGAAAYAYVALRLTDEEI